MNKKILQISLSLLMSIIVIADAKCDASTPCPLAIYLFSNAIQTCRSKTRILEKKLQCINGEILQYQKSCLLNTQSKNR